MFLIPLIKGSLHSHVISGFLCLKDNSGKHIHAWIGFKLHHQKFKEGFYCRFQSRRSMKHGPLFLEFQPRNANKKTCPNRRPSHSLHIIILRTLREIFFLTNRRTRARYKLLNWLQPQNQSGTLSPSPHYGINWECNAILRFMRSQPSIYICSTLKEIESFSPSTTLGFSPWHPCSKSLACNWLKALLNQLVWINWYVTTLIGRSRKAHCHQRTSKTFCHGLDSVTTISTKVDHELIARNCEQNNG